MIHQKRPNLLGDKSADGRGIGWRDDFRWASQRRHLKRLAIDLGGGLRTSDNSACIAAIDVKLNVRPLAEIGRKSVEILYLDAAAILDKIRRHFFAHPLREFGIETCEEHGGILRGE